MDVAAHRAQRIDHRHTGGAELVAVAGAAARAPDRFPRPTSTARASTISISRCDAASTSFGRRCKPAVNRYGDTVSPRKLLGGGVDRVGNGLHLAASVHAPLKRPIASAGTTFTAPPPSMRPQLTITSPADELSGVQSTDQGRQRDGGAASGLKSRPACAGASAHDGGKVSRPFAPDKRAIGKRGSNNKADLRRSPPHARSQPSPASRSLRRDSDTLPIPSPFPVPRGAVTSNARNAASIVTMPPFASHTPGPLIVSASSCLTV